MSGFGVEAAVQADYPFFHWIVMLFIVFMILTQAGIVPAAGILDFVRGNAGTGGLEVTGLLLAVAWFMKGIWKSMEVPLTIAFIAGFALLLGVLG